MNSSIKSILIVEDEAQLASLVAGYLRTLDYEVAGIAESGEKALELAAKGPISLALLDININGAMNGFGVAEALRRQYDVPSIFVTGQSDEETMQSVLDSSAYGYLLKPFRPEELKAAIPLAFIRHAQETRWKQLEQSFSAAVQSTSDGVIITDAEARIQFMNPAGEWLTGWMGRLAKGEKLSEIFQVTAGDDPVKKLWQAAFAGEPMRSEIEVGPKGNTARVEVSLTRVQDATHGPQGVVIVLRDTTQHFRDQSELRRSRTQIRTLTEQIYAVKEPVERRPSARM